MPATDFAATVARQQLQPSYPDEIDPDEDYDAHFARRAVIVKRHFGYKPIVYPPMPDDDGVQQFDIDPMEAVRRPAGRDAFRYQIRTRASGAR